MGIPAEMLGNDAYGESKCLIGKETSYELYASKQMSCVISFTWLGHMTNILQRL